MHDIALLKLIMVNEKSQIGDLKWGEAI